MVSIVRIWKYLTDCNLFYILIGLSPTQFSIMIVKMWMSKYLAIYAISLIVHGDKLSDNYLTFYHFSFLWDINVASAWFLHNILVHLFRFHAKKKMIEYSGRKKINLLLFLFWNLMQCFFCEIRLQLLRWMAHKKYIDILNLDILNCERTCLAAYNMQLLHLYDYLANFSLRFERYNWKAV